MALWVSVAYFISAPKILIFSWINEMFCGKARKACGSFLYMVACDCQRLDLITLQASSSCITHTSSSGWACRRIWIIALTMLYLHSSLCLEQDSCNGFWKLQVTQAKELKGAVYCLESTDVEDLKPFDFCIPNSSSEFNFLEKDFLIPHAAMKSLYISQS